MASLTLGFRLAALALTGLLLAAAGSAVHAQIPTSGLPSPCTAGPPPNVQAPAAGAYPVDGGFAIIPAQLSSLDDAAAQYDFPLLLPTDIPDGYSLGRIAYTHTQPGTPEMDLLMVCYVNGDGDYLQVTQGYPLPVGGMHGTPYAYTPDDEKGTATVQGQDAYWRLGELAGGGPDLNLVWQAGPLRLAWNTDILVPRPPGAFIQLPGGQPMPPPPLYIGYQLESNTLSLDDLVAIGNSVQPYGQAATPSSS